MAGIISTSGWMPFATAAAARMGRIISVVAVLLVSSVRKVIAKHTIRINTKVGTAPAAWN